MKTMTVVVGLTLSRLKMRRIKVFLTSSNAAEDEEIIRRIPENAILYALPPQDGEADTR